MPRAPPQNLSRSFNTRYTGIFRKAAELHQIDDRVRISIIVEKPGVTPLVFSTEERGHNWPPFVQDYVKSNNPHIKRPAHYQSVSDGISRGHVRIVRTSSPSPSPPYMPGNRNSREQTQELPNVAAAQESPPSYVGESWYLPATPPRPTPNRISTSSPLPINVVLPSKMVNGA
ncbi:hypothetical protein Ptr902_06084 [Pyrenophora tritici-repentis]|uniref:Uncharacterized protein n=1 Tax=Pyrenophora tritici-repentis TaxID=45151 RepID=A0A2W1DR26_9PLEO|nr:hypothetical protein Alg130_11723 [Pyrenophora tritici-repentis]KAI1508040.1 hypothetical protein Ptr86124_012962 [Pyrenophora tritici-repentis]KAI1560792.1 hypothetical protein PtrEW4_010983 [Pyrenophora tritici-repentis]KAI1562427.1 hypothetical protein PtrEW7m1_010941 [Pyrenophora tritici-repentis]KAI1680265.1 hypothetical protein KJE20_10905 [Pyrenophora tritici-repentis]